MRFVINGAGSDADEIVDKVVCKIKEINSASIRSNVGY
jgi:L-2-hydroxyglutarate oxidase LhgO